MKTEYLPNRRNYDIPCLCNISGREKTVCVVVHGFGSTKLGLMAEILFRELPPLGIGIISFDLPAHGESRVDGEFLRLSNCLEDLALVEARAHTLAPEAEIVFFASSFGAYITLIYLAGLVGEGQNKRRAFLRATGVSVPRIFKQRLTPEVRARLETTGSFTLHKEEYGYTRDLKLTQGFLDDLERHDVFTIWQTGLAELHMVHGESDQVVPLGDAQAFARMFHVPLTVIPNGDHQLSPSGAPEQVLKLAAEFYAEGK